MKEKIICVVCCIGYALFLFLCILKDSVLFFIIAFSFAAILLVTEIKWISDDSK